MAIGIIPFNHNNWYLYFRECPKEQECKCSEAQSVRDHFFNITKVRNAL